MYKRNSQGWRKHLDFILVDEVVLFLCLTLALFIRTRIFPYRIQIYRVLCIVYLLINLMVAIVFNTMHNVVKRGLFNEFVHTLTHCFLGFAFAALFLFATQMGVAYSRIALFLTFVFHVLFGFATRIGWKAFIKKRGLNKSAKDSMLVVLQPETADEMMKRLTASELEGYKISGVVLTEPTTRTEVAGFPIVATLEDTASYVVQRWIDAVYIDCSATDPRIKKLMQECREMALPTHYHVASVGDGESKRIVEKVGGTTVITTTINYATPTQLFAKRCLDIVGGIIGSFFALLIMLIIGPQIKKASPGPILYTQERIGKNGKRFRMIKLRSMYMDADERKKELMKQNRVKGGMMFKLDFDPRIIGNEILPDGTKKTGIGEFIRRTSLDEFPQFFNVLLGQMSLVGTRPPTVDEWEKYEYHHRARLACKPGITGMWQVSGRSSITDFEEVVKLDTDYINNWSFGLDIRILLQTVKAVLKHDGAM